MSPWKSLVMTLRVNHWEARFIIVLSQQTAECHSSSSAAATYIPAGHFWLPAPVPSWYQVNKGTASNAAATQISPGVSHTPCAHMCPARAATWLCPKSPQHCQEHQLLPHQRFCCFKVKQPLGKLLVYSTPHGFCIPLRCSATLGLLPAVRPNTADG